jgi:hypothetical protein
LVEDVSVSGENAYTVDNFNHLHIINVSDPANPQTMSVLKNCGICTQVVASSGHAFVTVWDEGVAIVDVHNLQEPVPLAQIDMPGGTHYLAVADNHLFVVHEVDRMAKLSVFEISNPAQPHEASAFELQGSGITDMIFLNDQVYIASEGRLEIIEVVNSEMPRKVGEFVISSAHPGNEWTSTVADNYGYMIRRAKDLTSLAELLVIDLSNPTQPQQISTLALSRGDVRDLAVANSYAYALGIDGMSAIDISAPDYPRQVGVSRFGGRRIFVEGDTLYVAGGEMGLLIFKVRSTESLK